MYFDVVTAVVNGEHHELSLRNLAILAAVHGQPECSVRDVHQKLGISKPSITRNAQMLAELGLLEIKKSNMDRRLVYISLTKKGKGFCKKYAKHDNVTA